jgi:hypothetical protein
MLCQECGQSYLLIQLVMLAHDYYKKLPNAPQPQTDMNEITAAEVRKAQKMLDSNYALRMLSESAHPDSPRPQREE